MAIRCGHCHRTHDTINEVRFCSIHETTAAEFRFGPTPQPQGGSFANGGRIRPAAKVTEAGFYRRGANVYEVVRSQAGRLYAKSLNREATKRAERWTYAPGAMAYLTPEMKMTREQAQEFGRETGICVNCGAELTHPVSIERGMGPICYGKWYDEN